MEGEHPESRSGTPKPRKHPPRPKKKSPKTLNPTPYTLNPKLPALVVDRVPAGGRRKDLGAVRDLGPGGV